MRQARAGLAPSDERLEETLTKIPSEGLSPQESPSGRGLGRLELGLAIAVTALVICCHFVVFRHAGGLWRDEINLVNTASMPTLGDIWKNLAFEDAGPLAGVLLVRAWTAIVGAGPEHDTALRLLGFLIGLGITGAIWLTARKYLKLPFPMLALVLVGLNWGIAFWGDSIRVWGFGSLTILLTAGLLWQTVQEPTRWRIVLTTLVAILAVQTAYHNAFLLLAVGMAAMGVAARRGHWRRVFLVAGIGLAAALSLLPYYGPITQLAHLASSQSRSPNFVRYGLEFAVLVGSPGNFMIFVWAALIAVGVAAAGLAQTPRLSPKLTPQQRDLALYAGLLLVFIFFGYALFLWFMNYLTNPWYYLIPAVLLAVALETALGVFLASRALRIIRILATAALAAACLICDWQGFLSRQTNVDLIAAELQKRAGPDDLIVVKYWPVGLTFDRYYHSMSLRNPCHRYFRRRSDR